MRKGEEWLWVVFSVIIGITIYPLTIGALVSGALVLLFHIKLGLIKRHLGVWFFVLTVIFTGLFVANFGYKSSGLGDTDGNCSARYDC